MLVCTKCSIEYEEGKKFCKNCGSPLVTKELTPKIEKAISVEQDKTKGMLTCTRCNLTFEAGKYCKNCGSPLVKRTILEESVGENGQVKETEPKEFLICQKCNMPYEAGKFCRKCGSTLDMTSTFKEKEEPKLIIPPPELKREAPEAQQLDKKSLKKMSKEWLNLCEEKGKLETLAKNLQAQRTKISGEVFDSTFVRYQTRLESISSKCQQIEITLGSIRRKASAEISLLEKELKPVEKKLQEIQSLYKAGALIKGDFVKQKKELTKKIKSIEKASKRHKKLIALLPRKMGGQASASWNIRTFLRPLPLTASGFIILIALAGYFLWPQYSYLIKRLISKEDVTQPPVAQPPPVSPPANPDALEIENIKSLLENIKQANLQKDIDLFMSCYSLDFEDREGKKKDTLDNWDNYDYLDLSYNLKNPSISGNTANARLEWSTRISSRGGDQPQDRKALYDVTFEKEEGGWKIKEIKSVS